MTDPKNPLFAAGEETLRNRAPRRPAKNPNTMQVELDELCAFKIGDSVCTRALAERWASGLAAQKSDSAKTSDGRPCGPPIYIINQRELVECHGGIQLHYAVRDELGQAAKFAEFELVPAREVIDAQQSEDYQRHLSTMAAMAKITMAMLEKAKAKAQDPNATTQDLEDGLRAAKAAEEMVDAMGPAKDK